MRDASLPVTTVRLVVLARLREALHCAQEDLPLDTPTTVADLVATLRARGGAWATELAPGRAVRVAVNHDLATGATLVRPGDEVALFPPVTGG
jgi:molybdopterin synthase sulfur carrier subunit